MRGLSARDIGGYLTMLEDTYGLISKHKPLFATANSNIRYRLDDNFLIFWFRFVFKYNYMLEIDAFEALRQIIRRDYETFSGKMLENYFKEKLAEEQQFTRIDNWWSRNGETEIDIIAINELTKQAAFYEVKRQAKELDSSTLDTNVNEFLIATRQLKKYSISYFGLSMQDM